MKKLKTYDMFNEGVRDKMTPKSEGDIIKSLQGLDPYRQMYKAIQFGLISVVKNIIESGIDLTKKISGGSSAGYSFATEAVEYGNLDILKYLLNNGCDLGSDGMVDYHLSEAVQKGHYEVSKYLVDMGATISDQEGDMYLQIAVDYNNLDLVKLVIEQDCLHFEEDWINDILLSDNTKPEIIKYMMEKMSGVNDFVKQMYEDYKKGVDILEKYV